MATILNPRFKKDRFQQNSNADQAEIGFENELVDLHNKENPNILNMELDSNLRTLTYFSILWINGLFLNREMGERMQF